MKYAEELSGEADLHYMAVGGGGDTIHEVVDSHIDHNSHSNNFSVHISRPLL